MNYINKASGMIQTQDSAKSRAEIYAQNKYFCRSALLIYWIPIFEMNE